MIADVGSLNKGGDGEKSAPLRKAGKSKRGAQILACAADGVADDRSNSSHDKQVFTSQFCLELVLILERA